MLKKNFIQATVAGGFLSCQNATGMYWSAKLQISSEYVVLRTQSSKLSLSDGMVITDEPRLSSRIDAIDSVSAPV